MALPVQCQAIIRTNEDPLFFPLGKISVKSELKDSKMSCYGIELRSRLQNTCNFDSVLMC